LVIAPILLYGSESWPTQEKHVSRITATEMRCCRKIVGKTKRDQVRSERIREQVGQESVRRVLEERQLKCEISSSHGSEYDIQNCLLGFTAV
jgi:hypothetical protein